MWNNRLKKWLALLLCVLLAMGLYAVSEQETPEGAGSGQTEGTGGEVTEEPAGEPTAGPTQAPGPTAGPTQEPTEDPGETAEPTEGPGETSEPTEGPTEEPGETSEPTEGPGETSEPTEEPGETLEPTEEPGETAEPGETPEPTAEPTEEPSDEKLEVTVTGKVKELPDGYEVSVSGPKDKLEFTWNKLTGAVLYRVEYENKKEETENTKFDLPLFDFLMQKKESVTVTVTALDETGETLDSVAVKLVFASNEGPGGFPGRNGGGRGWSGGFNFSFGSFRGGTGSRGAQPDMGFHITPGTPLTTAHSSGDGDMSLYGTVSLETTEGITELYLEDEAQVIRMTNGGVFSVLAEEGRVTLTGDGDFTFSARCLKTLEKSGYSELTLNGTVLETAKRLSGSEADRLSALGYVSKDYQLTVAENGITAAVADQVYEVDQNMELIGAVEE